MQRQNYLRSRAIFFTPKYRPRMTEKGRERKGNRVNFLGENLC